jgi:hypothetical protein
MALVNARRTASLVGPQGNPGPQGPTGAPGSAGSPGAVTSTTANYTQPAVNGTVSVSVTSTAAFTAGNYAAQASNFYIVQSVTDSTHLVLQLISGVTAGTVFSSPATVAITGPPGAAGTNGVGLDLVLEGNNGSVIVPPSTGNTTVGMHSLTAEKTVQFPAAPLVGQMITVIGDSSLGTYPVNILGNGNTIYGGSSVLMSGALATMSFKWTGITAIGWGLV